MYSEEHIRQEFERKVNAALEREKNWDVKIMDYVLENYKRKKLFYDHVHLSNDVIKQYCIGIFDILHIDCQSIGEINAELSVHEQPVYPCVIQALGLEWDNHCLREHGHRLIDKPLDFDEYYKEYLYWDYGI